MANKAFNATRGDKLFDIFNILAMTMVLVVTLYPFLNVLAISLNNSTDTVRGGIYLWPREFTLQNYKTIFQYDGLVTRFADIHSAYTCRYRARIDQFIYDRLYTEQT